ncbi:hypothetical protein FHS21_006218 [Phyllobacterium trifolii]|uniref:Uncharacterized protein n=1 Tax=Phyllobacterium trifolii TaxID=300193 RepID=A0A839UJ10_9HYPH|nr:hypothetical protein [Phyllobacterium trifolii]
MVLLSFTTDFVQEGAYGYRQLLIVRPIATTLDAHQNLHSPHQVHLGYVANYELSYVT